MNDISDLVKRLDEGTVQHPRRWSGEPLRHKTECQHPAHVHPWADLRRALSDGGE